MNDHPVYSFLTQDELDAVRGSIIGIKDAVGKFEFHFTVLNGFVLNMQSRLVALELAIAEEKSRGASVVSGTVLLENKKVDAEVSE